MRTPFKTQIFASPEETAERLVMDFIRYTEESLKYRDSLYIALSGGSTPQLMFEIISREFPKSFPWKKLHFFWVDERCVPFENPENNFGNAQMLLFGKVDIPSKNLHPIQGGDDPLNEVVRYTGEILSYIPCYQNIPIFDLVLLGMGNDGHTASIFPGQADLFETHSICSISENPQNHQKRITLTGRVINNAAHIVFLVTGKNKADTLRTIFDNGKDLFPAQKIKPINGTLAWYLDKDAALHLKIGNSN